MSEPKMYNEDELKDEIKKATDAIRAELSEERKSRKEFEKQFGEMKSEADKAKSEKEKAELLEKGKYDEALKKYQEEYEKKIIELSERADKFESQVKTLSVDGEILKHVTNTHNPEDAVILMKAKYNFENTDNGVLIKRKDGTPILDDKGKNATIQAVTNDFLTQNAHLVKANGTGGSGSGTDFGNKGTSDIETLKKQMATYSKLGKTEEVVALSREIFALENKT